MLDADAFDDALAADPDDALALLAEMAGATDESLRAAARRLAGRSDQEIAEDFVAHVRGAGPDEGEQTVLRDAFDAVRADETVREVAR